MTGRAKRLVGVDQACSSVRPGENFKSITPEKDLELLIDKINEISLNNIDQVTLHESEVLFKKLASTGESLKKIVKALHSKSMDDNIFGEKMVFVLDKVISLIVDDTSVRRELLALLQNDFNTRDTILTNERKRFSNIVSLLGSVYDVIRIGSQGKPITILGEPLLEYLSILVKGSDDEHKLLTKELFRNGRNICDTGGLETHYESLGHNLRRILMEADLNCTSRCWILLALDFMSNSLKPLSGSLRDLYVDKLGDEYLKIESLTQRNKEVSSIYDDLSVEDAKEPGNRSRGSTQRQKRREDIKAKNRSAEKKSVSGKSVEDDSDMYGIQINM